MTLSQDIRLARGVELAVEITDILNAVIEDLGHIDINDQRIWSGWLHQRSNADWLAIWHLMTDREQDLSPGQSQQIMQAMQYYRRNHQRERCMDRERHNKRYAWQSIMVCRELINAMEGRWIPNTVPA